MFYSYNFNKEEIFHGLHALNYFTAQLHQIGSNADKYIALGYLMIRERYDNMYYYEITRYGWNYIDSNLG